MTSIESKCRACGALFNKNTKKQVYCTRRCANKFHYTITNRKRSELRKSELTYKICPQCKKEFMPPQKNTNYCCEKCVSLAFSYTDQSHFKYSNYEKWLETSSKIKEDRLKALKKINLRRKNLRRASIKVATCLQCREKFLPAIDGKVKYCTSRCREVANFGTHKSHKKTSDPIGWERDKLKKLEALIKFRISEKGRQFSALRARVKRTEDLNLTISSLIEGIKDGN